LLLGSALALGLRFFVFLALLPPLAQVGHIGPGALPAGAAGAIAAATTGRTGLGLTHDAS
jgi:hypothetical protein